MVATLPLLANAMLFLLSLLMGLRLLQQYRRRRRSHTLWYAVGLLLLAAASLPEVWLKAAGSLPTLLWWLYWVAASGTVGFLAVGTAHLLGRTPGRIALGLAAILTLWLVVATVVAAGPAPAEFTEATLSKAPNAIVKVPFLIQNILGALVIMGGALWSYARTRALCNLWIALGTLVFSSGGAAAGLLQFAGAFYFTQMVGILLLYLGVTQSTAPRQVTAALT